MAFRVLLQIQTAFHQWLTQADGCHDVLQRFARAHMHVHITDSDQSDGAGIAHLAQLVEPNFVIECAQLLHADPAAAREVLLGPLAQGQQLCGSAAARW